MTAPKSKIKTVPDSKPGTAGDGVLTLFDLAGIFLTNNDEGSDVATDTATGKASDARITTTLTAGSYIVALTQFDNFATGDLASGFVESGHPNLTAASTFTTGGRCAGNLFRDISGTDGRCRDGHWAVDFLNVATVTPEAQCPSRPIRFCSALVSPRLAPQREKSCPASRGRPLVSRRVPQK